MSILIKGMKMPTCCGLCDMFALGLSRCKITDNYSPHPFARGLLENCPLVEIPPHGRLIDADNLRSLYEEWEDDEENGIYIDEYSVAIPVIRQNIDDMPTIIEEDGGE